MYKTIKNVMGKIAIGAAIVALTSLPGCVRFESYDSKANSARVEHNYGARDYCAASGAENAGDNREGVRAEKEAKQVPSKLDNIK